MTANKEQELDQLLTCDRFPLASQYATRWQTENPFGSNCLWLTEWLSDAIKLEPGMRVLDLGCGRAKSSIFLAREFGVQVWATDLWISATENWMRVRNAGIEDQVFPIHADARALPYPGEFFDAIVSIDSYHYYGTDESFLNTILHYLKPGGRIGFASTGLMREFENRIPDHLRELWTAASWTIHSADWWKQHWKKTNLVDIEVADVLDDGWRYWLRWAEAIGIAEPDINPKGVHYRALAADRGEFLGYVRVVGRRNADVALDTTSRPSPLGHLAVAYDRRPLRRGGRLQ